MKDSSLPWKVVQAEYGWSIVSVNDQSINNPPVCVFMYDKSVADHIVECVNDTPYEGYDPKDWAYESY